MQYRVLSTIQHNGEKIEPGALIDFTNAEAEPLLIAGAIEAAPRRFSREIVVPGQPDKDK